MSARLDARLGLRTEVRARLEEAGKLVEERRTSNFFTEVGEAYIADRLSDRNQADGEIDGLEIGIGSGRTRASTSLVTPKARVVVNGSAAAQGTGADDNDVIYTAVFGTGVPATQENISEGALFSNGTSGGTMINYFEFSPPLVKATSQSLTITVTVTVGAS